ncbi:MAG: hypothetical protein IIA07_00225 [Proteobacteria bacterium]|nr:hypothetical protein [Pseudomonadota bacterium]
MEAAAKEAQQQPDLWTLVRDVAVLQVKLLVDGFRDLMLLPAALIVGIVSLVKSENGKPGPQFYRLLVFGKRSEKWINLFGAIENSPEKFDYAESFGNADIDDIISRVEAFVIDEHRRGGVTAQAQARIHRAIAAMQRGKRGDLK